MSRGTPIAVFVAAAAALAAALWLGGRETEPAASAASPELAAAEAQERAERPVRTRGTPEPVAYFSGVGVRTHGTVEIPRSALDAGEPIVVNLLLPQSSRDGSPRPVTIVSPDGRLLETEGVLLTEDRRSATLEVAADWLVPGRHIVQMQTTEITHFPLRRYVLEVK